MVYLLDWFWNNHADLLSESQYNECVKAPRNRQKIAVGYLLGAQPLHVLGVLRAGVAPQRLLPDADPRGA